MNTSIPTITTSRLVLRALTGADADPLHQIMGERDVLRYFPRTEPPPQDRVQKVVSGQLEHWEEHGYGWWAVEPRPERRFIGWCGLQYLPETDEVEVAYLLARAFWGKGLATEGAMASLQYGFEQLQLDTIVAIVHPENLASRRVIEKLGMSSTGPAHYFGMDVYRYVLEQSSFAAQVGGTQG